MAVPGLNQEPVLGAGFHEFPVLAFRIAAPVLHDSCSGFCRLTLNVQTQARKFVPDCHGSLCLPVRRHGETLVQVAGVTFPSLQTGAMLARPGIVDAFAGRHGLEHHADCRFSGILGDGNVGAKNR